jgi:hypothetical protein
MTHASLMMEISLSLAQKSARTKHQIRQFALRQTQGLGNCFVAKQTWMFYFNLLGGLAYFSIFLLMLSSSASLEKEEEEEENDDAGVDADTNADDHDHGHGRDWFQRKADWRARPR